MNIKLMSVEYSTHACVIYHPFIRQAFLDKMGLEQLTPHCSDRGAMAWSEVEIRDPLLDLISYIWSGEVVPNHTY